jgi:hypothetical protein
MNKSHKIARLAKHIDRFSKLDKVFARFDKPIDDSDGSMGIHSEATHMLDFLRFVKYMRDNHTITIEFLLGIEDDLPSPRWYDSPYGIIDEIVDVESASDYIKWFAYLYINEDKEVGSPTYSKKKNDRLAEYHSKIRELALIRCASEGSLILLYEILSYLESECPSMTPLDNYLFPNKNDVGGWEAAKRLFTQIYPILNPIKEAARIALDGKHKTKGVYGTYMTALLGISHLEHLANQHNNKIILKSTGEIANKDGAWFSRSGNPTGTQIVLRYRDKNNVDTFIDFDDIEYIDSSIYRELKLKQFAEDDEN